MSDTDSVEPEEIWNRLSQAVGRQAAQEAVCAEIEVMGLDDQAIDFELALEVLNSLAQRDGLLGVSARFARSRWMLERARAGLKRSQSEKRGTGRFSLLSRSG